MEDAPTEPAPAPHAPDFRTLFESAPGPYLVFAPDLAVVAASDTYLRATRTARERIVGRGLLDVFPGARPLRDSLDRVLRSRAPDAMPVYRYDVRRAAAEGGGFEERHWSVVNSPVAGAGGAVAYIIHHAEDVTELVRRPPTEPGGGGAGPGAEDFLRAQQFQEVNLQLRTANEQLTRLRAELERHVEERTAQLTAANAALRAEVEERARAERALGQKREKLRVTLESIGDAVIATDAEGRVTLLNRVAEALTGWSAADAIGAPLADVFRIVDQHTRREVENPVRRVIREGRTVGLANHTLLIARDGTERPVDDSAAPIRDETGGLLGVVLIFRDVTERHAAEEALRRERALLRTLIDALPDAVWTKDAGARFVISNRAHVELVRAGDEAALAGKTGFDFHPPELAREYHADDLRVLRDGATVFNKEERVRHPDGTERWHLVIKAPLRDRDGRVTGLVGISHDIQARKEAEAALRASEALFRGAFDDTNVPTVLTDLANRFVRANAAFGRLFGRAADEMVGMTMTDITHPDDVAESLALRDRLLAGEPYFVQHKRYRHSDGRVLWGVTNVALVRDADGVPRAYVGQVQDVTARRAAEEELRASEGRLRAFFDSTTAGMVEIAPDGHYLRGNAAFHRMFGHPPEALPELTIADVVFPEDRERVLAEYARVARGEIASYEADRRYRRRDGSTLWARVSVVAADGAGPGRPAVVSAVVIDLTEHKLAEDALRASEERLRLLIDSVREYAIFTTDPDGRVVTWNPGAERAYGYPAAEAVGLHMSRFHPPDEVASGAAADRLSRAAEAGSHYAEAWRVRRDGTRFWSEVVTSALRDNGGAGALRGFVVVARDMTDRRKLEDQFRQAQKLEAVGRLAGGVAHDFNNLLTVINGYSDVLLNALPAADPHREALAAVRDAGERAAGLTNQLLAFSRKAIVEPRVLDLNEVIDQLARLLRRLVGEDVILATALAPGLHRVKADPTQLEQIILNLAVNARDAMPRGGRLTIETRNVRLREVDAAMYADLPSGHYVQLAVSDTGTGMTDAVKARVFEPFFTTKEQGKGTGLGLAMVYGAVKTHGGHVSVYSELNVGSTFKILLPATFEAVAPRSGEVRLAPRGSETILLAEDDDTVRKFARLALEAQGYAVLDGGSGADALRTAADYRGPIHLLVTDVVMPGVGGRELADTLRTRHPGLKVLYVSGYTDDAIVRHGIVEATDAFLQKPFTPLALARKVRAVLDGTA
ncbi:MAG: PAS domain S-box protein [Planctomycetes bacterium]|nr:PAS domain S-box protein [Planctomycetota bacterium]